MEEQQPDPRNQLACDLRTQITRFILQVGLAADEATNNPIVAAEFRGMLSAARHFDAWLSKT